MAMKRINAWEARRNLGRLMDKVVSSNQPIIIESHGQAKVALMPARIVEAMLLQRNEAFQTWKNIASQSRLTDEEADTLIEEAITEVRASEVDQVTAPALKAS